MIDTDSLFLLVHPMYDIQEEPVSISQVYIEVEGKEEPELQDN